MARLCSVLLTLLALAVLNAVPATAQAAPLDGVLRQAQAEGRLTADEAVGIRTGVDQARGLGLPQAPFVAKVEEGLAKRAGGQAIVNALNVMRGDYLFARDALMGGGTEPTPDDITRTGDSLRLGLTRGELSDLAALNAPPAMLATAARTGAALNAIGFPAPLSNEILRRGLSTGSLTPAWEQLFRAVQRTRQAGLPDAAAADAAIRVLADGGGPAEMLQELGLTGRDTRHGPGTAAQ